MQHEHTIIIGAGPCGLSTALALKEQGIQPLIIEKGNVVNTIHQFPTHQTFFSSSDRLEIGQIPFISDKQAPNRSEALAYYRTVAERQGLTINAFEKVINIQKENNTFLVQTVLRNDQRRNYTADHVVLATGYYDQPKWLNIPGEKLPKVSHYFKEAHPYFQQDIVIIGCKNSAVDAALELHKVGAHVTVIYRGTHYPPAIKPWILPKFTSLIEKDEIEMIFNAEVEEITDQAVKYTCYGQTKWLENDFVFAMTGYMPDTSLLKRLEVEIEEDTLIPRYHPETMETNVENCYIAGVLAAGYKNNAIFIETGKLHGKLIKDDIFSQNPLPMP